MYTNGLKDRFGSPLVSKKDCDKYYAPKPDYTAGVEVQLFYNVQEQSDYIISCDGWLFFNNYESSHGFILMINDIEIPIGVPIGDSTSSEKSYLVSGQILVSKGNVVKGGFINAEGKGNCVATFYPCVNETIEL